ncbi:Panacea domain-containing protein [Kosakonia oryzendophytica]|uniref:Panacea domain-containing protein n=1 Tax=Kosakonia oryzendophytica TaxID=1005665 RepID=UPI003D32E29E
MININQLCDYIITKISASGETMSNLKLQKLAYYADAWYLAFFDEKLVDEGFQAWIHGPVSRSLYNRFASTKSLYSDITSADCTPGFELSDVPAAAAAHIDSVLEVYGAFSGAQLEDMTHKEEPWIKAREGYRPSERCEEIIDRNITRDYYRSRLNS